MLIACIINSDANDIFINDIEVICWKSIFFKLSDYCTRDSISLEKSSRIYEIIFEGIYEIYEIFFIHFL